jgi:hypothetical protein
MSAHQGDTPTSPPGKRGDIQARQADDGSFELVVEDGDSSPMPAVEPPAVDRTGEQAGSSSGNLPRLVGWGLGLVLVVGALVWAFSGTDEQDDVSRSASEVAEGFRPYKGGGEEPADRPPEPARAAKTPAPKEQEEPDRGVAASAREEEDEEEGWEVEDEDVVIVEDDYDDEDLHAQDEVEADDERDEPPKVRLDGVNAQDVRDRIKLPAQPNLQRIPAQKLEQLRPPIRSDDLDRGANNGVGDDYVDEEYDEAYGDEGYEDEPDGDWDEEYHDDPDGWDEHDEGY